MPKEFFKTLSREKVKQLLDQQYDLVLLDLLPAEYYVDAHIQGAVNACIYDVNFLSHVEKLVPEKHQTIVVYCNGATSKAPDIAAKKLEEAGYSNIFIYRGGMLDWKRARNPIEGNVGDYFATIRIENKVYTVNVDESVVQWTGRNITGSHHGTIKIQGGSIPIMNRQPARVGFVIDMNSIENLDVQDPAWNRILVDHLKSEDFFDVGRYPTAEFLATAFKEIEGAAKGGGVPNYEVHGKLTIKGVMHEITFPAVLTLKEDGTLAAEAHFDIDRTRWNVNYGSGKLFEKLGRHLVHDFITIQLKLVAR